MLISSFALFTQRTAIPLGVSEFSGQLNFGLNQNLILLNLEANTKVKKIEIYSGVNFSDEVIKYFDIRFRCLNRDGANITEYAGDILNGLSGAFDGTLTKNTDLDIILSSKKNFIEFNDGIEIGGVFPISFSVVFYEPTKRVNVNFVSYLTIYHEQ